VCDSSTLCYTPSNATCTPAPTWSVDSPRGGSGHNRGIYEPRASPKLARRSSGGTAPVVVGPVPTLGRQPLGESCAEDGMSEFDEIRKTLLDGVCRLCRLDPGRARRLVDVAGGKIWPQTLQAAGSHVPRRLYELDSALEPIGEASGTTRDLSESVVSSLQESFECSSQDDQTSPGLLDSALSEILDRTLSPSPDRFSDMLSPRSVTDDPMAKYANRARKMGIVACRLGPRLSGKENSEPLVCVPSPSRRRGV